MESFSQIIKKINLEKQGQSVASVHMTSCC